MGKMKFKVENLDDFLIFIHDSYQIQKDLTGFDNQIEDDGPSILIETIVAKIKNFATEARLMDIVPILSILDPLLLAISLLKNKCTDSVKKQAIELVYSLLSLMQTNICEWETIVSQADAQFPLLLDCKIDKVLQDRARNLTLEHKNILDADESSSEADLSKETLIEFTKEGLSRILNLKAQLTYAQTEPGAVKELFHTLTMFKTDCGLLADSDFSLARADHAVHNIAALVEGMEPVLAHLIQQSESLTEDLLQVFELCLDELERLLEAIWAGKSSDESDNTLRNRLKELYEEFLQPETQLESVQEEKKSGPASDEPLSRPEPSKSDTFLPIRLTRIEDMGNLIGELIVAKNAFGNLRQLMNQPDRQKSLDFLKKTEDGFQRIISDLDKAVMKMRMQPIKSLFQKFPRMVRDQSKKMGKQIDVVFSGQEMEIDNRILNAISDPMMHLVRNAIDHGLELPEVREKAGKKATGLLKFSAKNHDQRTLIEIYDDGAGIDPAVIKKKVVEKKLMQPSEVEGLTDNEIRKLIFLPGFSTAETVSEISGRGVGMDVVLDNLKLINGSIDIESKTGQFTCIMLSLPLTISVTKGLKICFGKDFFLIPMDHVLRMTAVNQKNIHQTAGSEFAHIDSVIYPLLPLHRELGYDLIQTASEDDVEMVIVKNDNTQCCFAVDEIIGIEDIVIRPLPKLYSTQTHFFSGCTILSDGHVLLILDINKILKR